MLILGIETATPQIGVALGGHEGVLASAHLVHDRKHAESLVPTIEFTCAQAGIDMSELGAIAVDLGPGLFTGLRVGIATAKALAFALQIPTVGVSSLDLVAFPLRFSPRLVVAVIDARRGEVFHAAYRQVPGGLQRVIDPEVSTPAELASDLLATRDEVLLVGDGAVRYEEVFEEIGPLEIADAGLAYPSASSLVQLAHPRALREEFAPHWALDPLYLRQPDAHINWATRESASRRVES